MANRTKNITGLMVALWALVIVWQTFEHHRVREAAREEVIRRAKDISRTLAVVIRSQRFWGIVSEERLQSALKELYMKSEVLKSVALLNGVGDVLIAAGDPLDPNSFSQSGVHWDRYRVTVVNLVDLGDAIHSEGSNAVPTIVLPRPMGPRDGRREGPPRFPPPEGGTSHAEGPPPRPPEFASTNVSEVRTNLDGPGERRPDRRDFRRLPWRTEEERKNLLKTKGLHDLALVLSTDAYRSACAKDLWLRILIGGFAAIGVAGFSLGWQSVVKSSAFQMRLLRASEMNTHLREMNVAAAGLAHETRNPLNIIRGLAQMISKAPEDPDGIRKKAVEITDEVDRVTAQLNEFINYSKPREVRRSPVAIDTVVKDVARTLKSDLEDKAITLEIQEESLTVNADQQLLRQVLFNLLLNAIQSVNPHGQIQVVMHKASSNEAWFEIRDDGPGVPADQRKEIFRPYFTTREKGTGLGLAVVKQIAMVHGWDVECLANNGQGAVFRVSRLELVAPGTLAHARA